MKTIPLKAYGSVIEAEIDKGLLRSHGVDSFVSADDCGGMRPDLAFIGKVRLMVAESDLGKAENILKRVGDLSNRQEAG